MFFIVSVQLLSLLLQLTNGGNAISSVSLRVHVFKLFFFLQKYVLSSLLCFICNFKETWELSDIYNCVTADVLKDI